MFKKEIKFKDANGVEQTESLYFHLTQYEAVRLVGDKGDWSEYVNKLQSNLRFKDIRLEMEEIVLTAYGEKIEDRFVKKTNEGLLRDKFEYSEQFSSLMIGFLTDVNTWVEFMQGLTPDTNKVVNGNKEVTKPNLEVAKGWMDQD